MNSISFCHSRDGFCSEYLYIGSHAVSDVRSLMLSCLISVSVCFISWDFDEVSPALFCDLFFPLAVLAGISNSLFG
jgi:hypothetical protein